MKTKNLLILAVLVVILLVVYKLQQPGRESSHSSSLSQCLLPEDFDSTKISTVSIRQGERSVTLQRQGDTWVVKERYDYPADASSLKTLLLDLCDTRIAQDLTLTDSQKAELALTDDALTFLTLLDKDGKEIATLGFGRKHEQERSDDMPQNPFLMGQGGNQSIPLGRYIRLADGRCVAGANTFSRIDEQPVDWLDKDFLKIPELASASLTDGDGNLIWTASRADKNADFALQNLATPEGKQVNTSKLSTLKNAFGWMRFTDVADPKATPDTTGLLKPYSLLLQDFDGLNYTFSFGPQQDGKQFLRLNIAWNGATARTAPENESPEEKAKADEAFAKKVQESQQKAQDLQKRYSPWIFQMPASTLVNIPLQADGFFQDVPKPKEEQK